MNLQPFHVSLSLSLRCLGVVALSAMHVAFGVGSVVVGWKTEAGKGGRTTIIYHKGERWRVRKEINNEEWMNARRITNWAKRARFHQVFSNSRKREECEERRAGIIRIFPFNAAFSPLLLKKKEKKSIPK